MSIKNIPSYFKIKNTINESWSIITKTMDTFYGTKLLFINVIKLLEKQLNF